MKVMKTIRDAILKSSNYREGGVIDRPLVADLVKDSLPDVHREVINVEMRRMWERGQLMKIGTGRYVKPRKSWLCRSWRTHTDSQLGIEATA